MSRQSDQSEPTSSTPSEEDYATPPERDDLPEDPSLQGAVGGVPHRGSQAPPANDDAAPADDDDFAGFDAVHSLPASYDIENLTQAEHDALFPPSAEQEALLPPPPDYNTLFPQPPDYNTLFPQPPDYNTLFPKPPDNNTLVPPRPKYKVLVLPRAETQPKRRYTIRTPLPEGKDEKVKPPREPEAERRYAEFKKWNEEQKLKKLTRPNPFLHPLDYRKWRKQYKPKPIAGPSLTDVTPGKETRGVSTQTDVTFPRTEFPSKDLTPSQRRFWSKFKSQGTPKPAPSKFARLRKHWNHFKTRIKPRQRVDEEVVDTAVGTQTDLVMPSTQQRIPKQFRYISDQKRQRLLEKVHQVEMKALAAQRKTDELEQLITRMKSDNAISADFVVATNLQKCEERLPNIRDTFDSALKIAESLREKPMNTKAEEKDVDRAVQGANSLVDSAFKEMAALIKNIRINMFR